jgi:NhaP-type Na+/H+ or K+/H+ antiporter
MIDFIDRGRGAKKGIPTLILGASSVDDVFVIVLFTALLSMAGGSSPDLAARLLDIPVSVVLGILSGLLPGYLLYRLFARFDLRPPKRTLIVVGVAIGLTWLEQAVADRIAVASLLGVMAIGFVLLEKTEAIAHLISRKLKAVWVFAELLLFVLVGAQVNIHVAFDAGLAGAVVILAGLLFRSVGTYISLLGTELTGAERLFCVVAYLPKATVQAAIGAVPLAAGIGSGEVILAVAVLSILITAPLGAVGITWLGERILDRGGRSVYRFKDLRQHQGLPHVGERIRAKDTGSVWKVIEEKELWLSAGEPGKEPLPAIRLRLWAGNGDSRPGSGRTREVVFHSEAPKFEAGWEILYDF